jgi:ribonuclease VapC
VTWFVDASVAVAMLGMEEDWEVLAERLDQDAQRIWSPLAQWESVAGLRSRLRTTVEISRRQVSEFAEMHRIRSVAIGARDAEIALDAFQAYGKGVGHPARLNMSDCFAYACAKSNNARLLYKGDDFARTDLA